MLVILAGLGPYCAIQCSENGVLLTRKLCSGRTRSVKKFKRGCSSVGRASALQAGCQEFESPQLHQLKPVGPVAQLVRARP